MSQKTIYLLAGVGIGMAFLIFYALTPSNTGN
jgi:hypothetical protein